MVDEETQDFGVGTSSHELNDSREKITKEAQKSSKVIKRQSMLMGNITKEARQAHQLLCYPRHWATALASFHIILGILCIIFMSVHIYDCHNGCKAIFWTIGYGIWSGVLFVFTGSFGIWTSHNSYRGTIAFYTMLCFITACECSLPFSFAVCDSVYSRYNQNDSKKLWRIMIGLVAAASLIEAILAMISAILCCRTMCRGTKKKKNKKKSSDQKSSRIANKHKDNNYDNNNTSNDNYTTNDNDDRIGNDGL